MVINKTHLLVILLISLLISYSISYAQTKTGLAFIVESNPLQSREKRNDVRMNFPETSEMKLFSMGLIRFYQLFISSQDIPVCNFTPSCSQFGMKAIKKYGFFHGVLLTSDRLQRCHGLTIRYSPQYYPFDEKTGKLFDPVENYSKEVLYK
jgi:putative membrane protein insertion efficiency factor